MPPTAVPSTAPAPTTTLTSTTIGGAVTGLAGFATIDVVVGGETWAVAVADTPDLRAQGLMGVTDLGGLQGMLFLWEADTAGGFWMKDTLIPLDIAFFDADGSLVDLLSMEPCEADPCPTYRPSGPYRAALEVPAGGFDGVGRLDLTLP